MASDPLSVIKEMIKALAEKEELHVNVSNLKLAAGIVIVTTSAGALTVGILGILAGAAVGGLCLVYKNAGFKPLSEYLKNLSPEIQERFYNGVMFLLKEVAWHCLDVLLEKVLKDTKLKDHIIYYIKGFFEGSVQIKVVHKKAVSHKRRNKQIKK